ncbi:MAG: hypothetical protein ABI852_04445, partial [Gemmatimonadaceae bacterium]
MNRPVPFIKIGLRAVALAAMVGGQSACVQSVPVATSPDPASRALSVAGVSAFSAAVRTSSSDELTAPQIVVRDYWGAPRADVVAWADNESWQGLRSAIRRDGTLAWDHFIYFSAFSAPDPRAFRQANWYAFNDDAVGGTP